MEMERTLLDIAPLFFVHFFLQLGDWTKKTISRSEWMLLDFCVKAVGAPSATLPHLVCLLFKKRNRRPQAKTNGLLPIKCDTNLSILVRKVS